MNSSTQGPAIRLPKLGAGPLYVAVIALCTLAETVLRLPGILHSGRITTGWLREAFGAQYTDYAKRVNRCLPFPPRIK